MVLTRMGRLGLTCEYLNKQKQAELIWNIPMFNIYLQMESSVPGVFSSWDYVKDS